MGLLGLIKGAATNIPWSKVAQSTPIIVELLDKARARMRQHGESRELLDEHLKQLQQENERLTTALLQVSENVQSLTARVSMLTKIASLSLILALVSIVVSFVK